jgi:hypothetical protein
MPQFSLALRASSNRKKPRLRHGTRAARRLSARVRLSVECLEDRTLLSTGQWLAHVAGLPGDTRQVQIDAAVALLHDAGLDGGNPNLPPVQVINHAGADGILVLQTRTTLDQVHLTSELQRVPGFDYVEPYDPSAPPSSYISQFQFYEHPELIPSGSNAGGSAPRGSSGSGGISPNVITPINGFDGINSTVSMWQPPDTNGAVGPNSYIEHINTALAIFNKSTGAYRVSPVQDETFFAPLGGVLRFSDPVTVYDEIRQRFVTAVLDFDTSSNCRLDVAMSTTSDPATLTSADWNFFRFDTNDHVGGNFVLSDYPKIGYNADGYMFSFNMFPNLAFYDHVSVLAVRADGTSPGIKVVPGGFNNFTFAPATMHGSNPGDSMWFVQDANEGGANNVAHVVRMDNPFSATPTFVDTSLPVTSYTAPVGAPQLGGGGTIDTLDARFYFSALRNGHLWAAHTVGTHETGDTAPTVSRVRWYDFDISGAAPIKNQEGEINQGANVFTYLPSLDVNASGAVGLNFSQSSTTQYWSMYVTGRSAADPAGTMTTPFLAKAGVANSPDFRAGDYSFVSVDPVDGTFWAINEYGTSDPFWSTWIENFRAEPPAGPSVVSQAPTNAFGQVSSLRLSFDESIDVNSFTADKIRSFTDPAGNAIAVADADITPVAGSNDSQFDISFASQTTLGVYTILVGPDILDTFGHPMDQNHNGIPGEDPGDIYTGHFAINGPRIIAGTDQNGVPLGVVPPPNYLPGNLTAVLLTFNEPINPVTFNPSQVVFTSPTRPTFFAGSVTPIVGSNNTRFTVQLPAAANLTAAYTLTVLPTMQDMFGNQLDQNGNFIPGEIPDDDYVLHFNTLGPRVMASSPATSLEPINSIRVTFNEPIDVTTFTPAKIASFSGPGGPLGIDLISVVPGTTPPNTQFDIWFPAQARTGTYTMVIGPDIRDLAGNKMDQNGNLIPGEVPGDQFTALFTVGGLRITAATNFSALPTDHVRLTFNEPVNPTTFTPAQVVSLTGSHGAISITVVSPVPLSNNTQFDVAFAPQSAAGTYTLIVGPHIRDLYGNEMDQNGNFIPGEDPGDRFTTTFSLVGPLVVSASPAGGVLPPVDHVRVTFNEPMNPDTFTANLVTLTGPGGPIDVAGVTPVAGSHNTQFDVGFAAQTVLGAYTIIVGPGIMDPFGESAPQFTAHFALALLNNGGFETGDFTGWTRIGTTAIKTSSFGTGPTEGTYDALITNDGGPDHTTVEPFLGLATNALASLVSNVTNGSAIKQTITVSAGLTLTFDWNFLTTEAPGETFYRDFGFLSITPVGAGGTLVKLADTVSSLVAAPPATGFGNMTGFHTFTFTFTTDGTYVLGVGAMNAGDTAFPSALLVDNFQVTPPAPGGSRAAGGGGAQGVARFAASGDAAALPGGLPADLFGRGFASMLLSRSAAGGTFIAEPAQIRTAIIDSLFASKQEIAGFAPHRPAQADATDWVNPFAELGTDGWPL